MEYWEGNMSETNQQLSQNKHHKVIENSFEWVPLDKRKSKFGGPMPPREAELRHPVLWLAREGKEFYLVNSSTETLDFVVAATGGLQSVDDDCLTIATSNKYAYKNVKQNDAVKVEEFDDFCDLDFVLQVSIKVKSKNMGSIKILTPPKKGGIGETVLLWDTMKNGKHASITDCK